MEVNDALINSLSDLAYLEFTATEKEGIKSELQQMIQFVEKLNELDTSNVTPLLHMGDEINVLRADLIEGSVSRQDALRNAPLTDGSYFKVPKVIKTPKAEQ